MIQIQKLGCSIEINLSHIMLLIESHPPQLSEPDSAGMVVQYYRDDCMRTLPQPVN